MNGILSSIERKGILALCALRKLEKRRETYRRWEIGRLWASFRWGDPDSLMGRFGGGWNWELGIQIGRGFRTWVFNLLMFSVTIGFSRKEEK